MEEFLNDFVCKISASYSSGSIIVVFVLYLCLLDLPDGGFCHASDTIVVANKCLHVSAKLSEMYV